MTKKIKNKNSLNVIGMAIKEISNKHKSRSSGLWTSLQSSQRDRNT